MLGVACRGIYFRPPEIADNITTWDNVPLFICDIDKNVLQNGIPQDLQSKFKIIPFDQHDDKNKCQISYTIPGAPDCILGGQNDGLLRVEFLPGVNEVIAGALDGSVKRWDLTSKTQKSTLQGFRQWCNAISSCKNNDGYVVASGDKDGNIQIWTLPNGELKGRFDNVHSALIKCMVISSDCCYVISGGDDDEIKVTKI